MKRSFSFRPKRSDAEKSSFSNQAHLLIETPFKNLKAHYENEDTSVPLRYNRHEKSFSFRPERSDAEKSSFSYGARPLIETPFKNLMPHYENEDASVPLRYNRYEKVFFISTRTRR